MSNTMEVNNCEALPLLALNHVSLICTSVGSYVGCIAIGIGIHLIENPSIDDLEFWTLSLNREQSIQRIIIYPSSVGSRDVDLVMKRLEYTGMKYVTAVVEDEGNKVDQVFFHDPDGYMVELCNCDNIPILPLSPCSFKPRLSSFNKSASSKCGFMENAMMESLSMEMLNISF